MYFQIVVNITQINGIFDYHVPEELQESIRPGCLVEVPFGKQLVQGIVLQETEMPQVQETRPIHSLLDSEPVVTQAQMTLAQALAEKNLDTTAQFLSLMIPPGVRKQADTLFTLNPDKDSSDLKLSPLQQKILERIRTKGGKEGLRGRQLDAHFRNVDWKVSMRSLVRQELVFSRAVLPPPSVQPKMVHTAQLSCTPAEVEKVFNKVGRQQALERRQKILNFLKNEPWPVEVSWVYAVSGGNLQDLKQLAKMGLVTLGEAEFWRDPLENIEWVPQEEPQLTEGQKNVWLPLQESIRDKNLESPFVLLGVTGSGKTEIYMQAVKEVISQGKQAIILVPEIALTPQTVKRFMARFPGQVGLVHSKLSEGERYDTWRRARQGELSVIVGPRSALFTPLPDPGLIVIDECHDDSYYQNDFPPTYDALETAVLYGQITQSCVILGSATPPVSLLFKARRLGWPVLELPKRIMAHQEAFLQQMKTLGVKNLPEKPEKGHLELPAVQIVDMRQELKAGNHSIFSRSLTQSIAQVLDAQQQAILFLNRRGKATYVFCRDCGHSLRCPRCDLPLTYHTSGQEGVLICHTCNYRRKMPKKCPNCGSARIRQFGTGTEKVESELQKAFPDARILRWDAGTTGSKGAHEIILSHFANHRADILIGTQMLAKGLDLPLVTLVGVILADVGLNLPDYRAGERVFQLLTQVAGRAGRSPLGGKVILQTFDPSNYAIQAAAGHDYQGFYDLEIKKRQEIAYPPFSTLVRLEFRHQDPRLASETAKKMARQVEHWISEGAFTSTRIIGPVPCFFSRQMGKYRWQIILSGPDPLQVLRGKNLGEWKTEVNPPSLL